MVNPYYGPMNDAATFVGGQGAFVTYTTGSQTVTGFALSTVATQPIGTALANSNSPYNCSDTYAQLEYKIVGCGLRVRNITSVLNRGGSLIGLETGTHAGLGGFTPGAALYTPSVALLEDTCERMSSTSNEWQSVVWHPRSPADVFTYNGNYIVTLAPAGPYSATGSPLGFIMPNSPSQTYEWEAYVVFEAYGQVAHGLTPSLSDPNGMAVVQNITQSTAARKPKSGDRAKWVATLLGKAIGFAKDMYLGYQTMSMPHAASSMPIITSIE